jgi:hypothetical protein
MDNVRQSHGMVLPFTMDDACAYPSRTIAVGRVMLLHAILHASGLDGIQEAQRKVDVLWR